MRKSLIIIQIIISVVTFSCKSTSPVGIDSVNPHYFSFKGKPLVLITSDHHYGAIIDRDFDYVRFINYLSVSGMNLTRIYPGGMFELPDKYQPGNPLGPERGRQILPWSKSNQTGADSLLAKPGEPSYKYDLDRWNQAYFDRLKAFVKYASDKDIIVEVAFFNGMYNDCWPLMAMYHKNNIQNIGNYEANECGLFTSGTIRNQDVMRYQKEYIVKLTTELNGFDNLIYDICDEPSLQGIPGGGVKYLPDNVVIPWINEMKDAFLKTEESLPKKHLLGQTVQNLSPDFSGEEWCEWLPTEYVKPAANALKLDYKTNKPLVDVESNYFGMSLTKNGYTADAVRLEGWWFMLSGGAGCINLNGEYHRGQEKGGKTTEDIIVPQRKILKDFMTSLDLYEMLRFTDFKGTPAGAFCDVLADYGRQYALYIFHGGYEGEWGAHFIPQSGNYKDTIVLNNVPAGIYLIDWIDPVTGSVRLSKELKWKGGNLSLETPEYTLDIAMKMKRK